MMCHHCEAAVTKALEAVDGVLCCVADFEKGTAVVTLAHPVDDALLRKAVEDEDYGVISIGPTKA